MKLAIASGKGGTGKTSVSASLFMVWNQPVVAVDQDVEEPNLHLFLNPVITESVPAFMPVPKINEERCTHCGKCAQLCQFKAISVLGKVILTFPEMCHGCGGCRTICPEAAISEDTRQLGDICRGRIADNRFLMGRLRVGEAMSPPLMREVNKTLTRMLNQKAADVIVDSPPGVSCPAVNAVMESDVILLITEPTPFGLHDLRLAWNAFHTLGKPMGVVVNRAGMGNRDVYAFCAESSLEIWAEIPYERQIAEAYAQGHPMAEVSTDLRHCFETLAARVKERAPIKAQPAGEEQRG